MEKDENGSFMFTEEVRESIEEYITENYRSETKADGERVLKTVSETVSKAEITKDAENAFLPNEALSLDELMNEVGESFHDKLFSYVNKSGMKDAEVYKRACIDRKLFSKIRSNPVYHPRKQTVLALAIALRLTIGETEDLLARAEYALSPGSRGDLIVRYFIERGIYDILAINFALDKYGQPILE